MRETVFAFEMFVSASRPTLQLPDATQYLGTLVGGLFEPMSLVYIQ